MFGKEKKDSGDPLAWYWKGEPAKKHIKDLDMMANVFQGRRRAGSSVPGRGFLRMSVPPGLPIRRRPDGGLNLNPYRNELGPGFRSGENLDRQLQRQELQCRPRGIHPSPVPPPQGCSAPPPHCLPPMVNRRAGPGIDMPPNRPPPDRYPARHHAAAALRQRPLTRQEYPPHIRPGSRRREFAPCGPMGSSFMFPTPDIDDDCYSVSSDGDSTDSEDSDWDSTWGEPFYPTRFEPSPFRYQGRGGRSGSHSDDTVVSGYLSDDMADLADRRHRARMFDRMGDRHVRGRAPRRSDFGPGPGYPGLRTTSSESRRDWFCPQRY